MTNFARESSPASLAVSASPGLNQWLQDHCISLGFTTYQTNRLFFVGGQANGRLKLQERLFDKPMGLHTAGDRLYLTTRYQLWEFNNLLQPEPKATEDHPDEPISTGHKRLYVPHTAHTTGDVNAHEVVVDGSGQIIFVNTDFSCLATLSPEYSFVPMWQPPFISKLVAEDRCHLNGLAMVDSKPKYVTACSATDTAAGWRNCRHGGGVVIDVDTNEIIATGLSMPHSPRWYRGKLWLMNSGTGEFGWIEDGQFQSLTFCPGFVRGLAFWRDWAVIGLSKLRSSSFTGLPLEERLRTEGNQAHCGLMVIDLNTGEIVQWLHLGTAIEELFDVVVLPEVQQAQMLGLQGDDIQRMVKFPGSNGVVTTKPTVHRPSQSGIPVAGLPSEATAAATVRSMPSVIQTAQQALDSAGASRAGVISGPVKFQRVYHLTPENLLDYDALSFPRLSQRWQQQPPRGELLGISASIQGTMVGFVVAERSSPEVIEIISLMVIPECRKQGIGTRLLSHLEQDTQQQGCEEIRLIYPLDKATQTALEPLLNKQHWHLPVPQGTLRHAQKRLPKTHEKTNVA